MPRPSRLPIDAARAWATREVAAHPRDFTQQLAAHFGVTRAGAGPLVRQLEREGFVVRVARSTRPRFEPGPSRLLVERVALPGVDESALWEQRFAPWLDLPDNLRNIVHYAFTEMVNNANDHASAAWLEVRVMRTAEAVYLTVLDDGIGAFRRIAQALALPDERLAVLELAKGKFSSDPKRHSGGGVFFTSRAVDAFLLRANGLEYRRHQGERWPARQRLADLGASTAAGTSVVMAVSLAGKRTLRETFDAYTLGAPEDYDFDRTVVPVKLAQVGSENLLSRSQAKRLTSRFERFRRVELDFADVREIGQAFADELFRVFVQAHPQVEIVPLNAALPVSAMIRRAGFKPS